MITLLKKLLFFFFISVFAFCIALLVHEIGHAFFVYAIQGYMPKMTMGPLSGGHISYHNVPMSWMSQSLISGGGIIFGIVFGAIFFNSGHKYFQNVWAAPLLFSGVVSLSLHALMLVFGAHLFQSGDVVHLVSLGISKELLIFIGLCLAVYSLHVFIQSLDYFELSFVTAIEKILVINVSVLVYSIIAMVFVHMHMYEKFYLYLKYVMLVNLTLILGILAAHYAEVIIYKESRVARGVTWSHVAYSFVISGILFVALYNHF